jgi:cytochrome oxidase assembly protein ShyY1
VLRTLREPRYLALSVVMVIVALACIGAGSWQIARFQQKVDENHVLRDNAHSAPVPVERLLPLLGAGSAPSNAGVEYRSAIVTGTYDATGQTLVRARTINDVTGFLVVTPLRTSRGVLLVVRGFLPQLASGGVPVPADPPPGAVTLTGRAHPGETRNDAAAQLNQHQVESLNPAQQASRLGAPTYNGYIELDSRQPGTRGLQVLPQPDLSNPAGGALEPQHFAYIIQWYLFAALALAAPVVMARAENKNQSTAEFDAPKPPESVSESLSEPGSESVSHSVGESDSEPRDEQAAARLRAAKLADRYGRAR